VSATFEHGESAAGEPSVVLRLLEPTDAHALGEFFERLAADPGSEHFHPHSLSTEYARELCSASGRQDEFIVAVVPNGIVGYAMLRGWDEGYSIPAFGVAVDRDRRGEGLGRALLEYALTRARERGASEVMLKVHPDNAGAKHLYESVGFRFDGLAEDGVQLKGMLALAEPGE
jgi:ribosomal protein S18 acetylase RimI-like enzyme